MFYAVNTDMTGSVMFGRVADRSSKNTECKTVNLHNQSHKILLHVCLYIIRGKYVALTAVTWITFSAYN